MLAIILLILYLWIFPLIVFGQDSSSKGMGIIPALDLKSYDTLIAPKPGFLFKSFADNFTLDTFKRPNTFFANHNFQPTLLSQKNQPILSLNNAIVSYHFLYRSNIDTPFLEKNIGQHSAYASFGFTLFGLIPFQSNVYLRRSNSKLFRNITDVQVQFDANQYGYKIVQNLKEKLYDYSETLRDTITEQYYFIIDNRLAQLSKWFKDPLVGQKLVEANEVLNVPEITYDKDLSDSVNIVNNDSLRRIAKAFIETYNDLKRTEEHLSRQADSLKKVYEKSYEKVKRIQQFIRQPYNEYSYQELKKRAEELGLKHFRYPTWLLGVKNLGIGKNNIYASELTAKNVMVSGVNFEYNSWYYLQVVAGAIDYRYRDFLHRDFSKPRQNLYLLRVGFGNEDQNSFILSAFHGQKQFFGRNSSSPHTTTSISGLSLQARWQLQENSYLVSEAAQSFSPTFPTPASAPKKHWKLSETGNKAMSLKLYSYFPKTSSHLEADYKFMGADFQSFNSFQSNSQIKSWRIKAEQNFLNRKIRLSANISTNEFINPFIQQNYKSNTVFKTIGAQMNIKKWPVISIGYLPMSQMTMVDGYLSESKFQTVNASITHLYKIGQANGSSNFMLTRFFNNNTDTGFIYFNSVNIFAGQSFLFRNFTININFSNSTNHEYTYTVVDEAINFPINDNVNMGVSVKLNKLNKEVFGLGGGLNGNLKVFGKDIFSFQVERSYLPARGAHLVPGVFGSLNYTKTLK